MSIVSVACFQVEVCATSRSLVQSPTDCGCVTVCDRFPRCARKNSLRTKSQAVSRCLLTSDAWV